MRVFLGGTCNESAWRNQIIPMLEIGFFNPVVDDWTPECMEEELRQREECDVCLYVITPMMTGVYSIAEVVDDSNKRPSKTVFVRLRDDEDKHFTDGQWKSLGAVSQMVTRNGGAAFDSLEGAALHINAMSSNLRDSDIKSTEQCPCTTPPAAPVQEPDHGNELTIAYMGGVHRGKELAAQRQWVGLTDEEIEKGRDQTFSINNPYCPCDSKTMRKAVRWAEAKLKEKNGGVV